MTRAFRVFPTTYANRLTSRSRGYLPHWEVDGGIYFVTYRLADSLPYAIARRLVEERIALIDSIARGREPTAVERAEIDRMFFVRLDGYLDQCHGSCILRSRDAADIVAGNLRHLDGGRHRLIAWAVMPNHVHAIFELFNGKDLGRVMHSWKSYTSKRIGEALGMSGRIWQVEYFDRLVCDTEDLRSTVCYVMENPIRAGLKSWEWVWAGEIDLR